MKIKMRWWACIAIVAAFAFTGLIIPMLKISAYSRTYAWTPHETQYWEGWNAPLVEEYDEFDQLPPFWRLVFNMVGKTSRERVTDGTSEVNFEEARKDGTSKYDAKAPYGNVGEMTVARYYGGKPMIPILGEALWGTTALFPYIIENPYHLARLSWATAVNYTSNKFWEPDWWPKWLPSIADAFGISDASGYYRLARSISMNGSLSHWGEWNEYTAYEGSCPASHFDKDKPYGMLCDCKIHVWRPIGTPARPFHGTFDGGDDTGFWGWILSLFSDNKVERTTEMGFKYIGGLYVNQPKAWRRESRYTELEAEFSDPKKLKDDFLDYDNMGDFAGLFGCLGHGAQVKNFGVSQSFIHGRSYVGGIAGRADQRRYLINTDESDPPTIKVPHIWFTWTPPWVHFEMVPVQLKIDIKVVYPGEVGGSIINVSTFASTIKGGIGKPGESGTFQNPNGQNGQDVYTGGIVGRGDVFYSEDRPFLGVIEDINLNLEKNIGDILTAIFTGETNTDMADSDDDDDVIVYSVKDPQAGAHNAATVIGGTGGAGGAGYSYPPGFGRDGGNGGIGGDSFTGGITGHGDVKGYYTTNGGNPFYQDGIGTVRGGNGGIGGNGGDGSDAKVFGLGVQTYPPQSGQPNEQPGAPNVEGGSRMNLIYGYPDYTGPDWDGNSWTRTQWSPDVVNSNSKFPRDSRYATWDPNKVLAPPSLPYDNQYPKPEYNLKMNGFNDGLGMPPNPDGEYGFKFTSDYEFTSASDTWQQSGVSLVEKRLVTSVTPDSARAGHGGHGGDGGYSYTGGWTGWGDVLNIIKPLSWIEEHIYNMPKLTLEEHMKNYESGRNRGVVIGGDGGAGGDGGQGGAGLTAIVPFSDRITISGIQLDFVGFTSVNVSCAGHDSDATSISGTTVTHTCTCIFTGSCHHSHEHSGCSCGGWYDYTDGCGDEENPCPGHSDPICNGHDFCDCGHGECGTDTHVITRTNVLKAPDPIYVAQGFDVIRWIPIIEDSGDGGHAGDGYDSFTGGFTGTGHAENVVNNAHVFGGQGGSGGNGGNGGIPVPPRSKFEKEEDTRSVTRSITFTKTMWKDFNCDSDYCYPCPTCGSHYLLGNKSHYCTITATASYINPSVLVRNAYDYDISALGGHGGDAGDGGNSFTHGISAADYVPMLDENGDIAMTDGGRIKYLRVTNDGYRPYCIEDHKHTTGSSGCLNPNDPVDGAYAKNNNSKFMDPNGRGRYVSRPKPRRRSFPVLYPADSGTIYSESCRCNICIESGGCNQSALSETGDPCPHLGKCIVAPDPAPKGEIGKGGKSDAQVNGLRPDEHSARDTWFRWGASYGDTKIDRPYEGGVMPGTRMQPGQTVRPPTWTHSAYYYLLGDTWPPSGRVRSNNFGHDGKDGEEGVDGKVWAKCTVKEGLRDPGTPPPQQTGSGTGSAVVLPDLIEVAEMEPYPPGPDYGGWLPLEWPEGQLGALLMAIAIGGFICLFGVLFIGAGGQSGNRKK